MKYEGGFLKEIFISKLMALYYLPDKKVLYELVKDVYIDKDGLILCVDNYYDFLRDSSMRGTVFHRYLCWLKETHNVWYVGNIDLDAEFGFYRLVLGGRSIEEFFDLLDIWGKVTQ